MKQLTGLSGNAENFQKRIKRFALPDSSSLFHALSGVVTDSRYSGFTITFLLAISLAACSSVPSRQTGTQTAAPIVEANNLHSQTVNPIPSLPAIKPGRGGYLEGDGPGADEPANIDAIPDAIPKNEPLHRFANRKYEALGITYTPLTEPGNYKERGVASWYGRKFHGQRTASGETYDMYGMTAAHPTLPIPSYARVTNLANNKSVIVRINDRGPFLHERIMDLSYTAAHKLGIVGNGSSEVEVESIMPEGAVITTLANNSPVISEPLPPAPVATNRLLETGTIYLQLGAFKSRQGAESFLAKMHTEFDDVGKQIALYQKDDFTRVHLGPYSTQQEAHLAAEKLESRLGFKPMVTVH
jgi:rare lipoprotein A